MRLLSGLVGIVCLLSLVQTVLLAATLNWPAGNAGSTADRSMAMQTGRHTASTQPQTVSPICLLCAAAWQGQTAHGLSTPGLPASLLHEAAVSCSEAFRAAIDAVPFGDRDCNALAKALLSGDKSDVSRTINDAFRESGASHILALSGMHLGVMYWILLKMTSVFGNFPAVRKTRSCLIILISAWYTLITGASASLVRALLFISLNESAKMAGRETRPMNTFFIALVVQLTISPHNVTEAGFQLSYLAMAGIYLVYPKMKDWYPGNGRNPLKRLWDTAALSISCQLFTGPAVWLIFGTFPKYFLVTNLLAVPLSTFIMILSAAAVFLHHFGLCPDFLISLGTESIRLLTDILSIVSSLP